MASHNIELARRATRDLRSMFDAFRDRRVVRVEVYDDLARAYEAHAVPRNESKQ